MPKPIVTFDFDDTLCMEDGTPRTDVMGLVHKYASEGYKCYVVTARNKDHESARWVQQNGSTRVRVKDFIRDNQLPIKQCHYTNHELKGPILAEIGAVRHYDNDERHIESAKQHGVEAILVLPPSDIVHG